MSEPLPNGKSSGKKLIGATLLAAVVLLSFVLPLRPAPWNAMEITLTPRKLAEGVYALVSSTADTNNPAGIPEATTGGIILGEKGVLVIESMLNTKLANQVLDQVSRLTDKPIRYVVNTVYHGDHYYGNFLSKPGGKRGSGTQPLKSAFDEEELYELTELGEQFVHYAMTDLPLKINYKYSADDGQSAQPAAPTDAQQAATKSR